MTPSIALSAVPSCVRCICMCRGTCTYPGDYGLSLRVFVPIHAKQATDGVYNSLQQLGLLKAMQDEAGRQPIES